MSKKPRYKRVSFSIPVGAIASFIIFIYLITQGVWEKLSYILKVIVIIGLILLFFFGEIEYEKEIKVNA